MRFARENGMIEMRDAPALRDMKVEILRKRIRSLCRDIVPPCAEGSELTPIAVKGKIAVHHAADPDRVDARERRSITRLHICRERRIGSAYPFPCRI